MTRAAPIALAAALVAACSDGSMSPTPPPPRPGTIGLASAAHTVVEGTAAVTFTIRRTGGSSGVVSVGYSTTEITARAWVDYDDAYGALTWADGDGADKTVTLWIRSDALVEGDETFAFELGQPTNGALLGTRSALVTIDDDETPAAGALRFAAQAYAADEDVGSMTIEVERSGGSAGPVSATCATGAGGATEGEDYAAAAHVLSWADGDVAPKACTVAILDDALPEAYETVPVLLHSATGGAVVASPGVTLTIRNDDSTVRLDHAALAAAENGGALTISATKVGETGPVRVDYMTTGGDALPGQDFTPTAGWLTWAERQTGTLQLQLPILNDAVREGDETVVLTLWSPTGGATLGEPSSVTVTIVDDEPPAEGLLELTSGTFTVSNSSGGATISVRRTGGTAGTVTVSYATADGTAAAPSDYLATSGTLTWGPGDGADKTFSIPIVDDLVDEVPETLAVSLSSPTGGAALGPRKTAQVTISDDWTRHGYVFLDSATGWDETAVSSPSVVRLGPSSYVMYYQGERHLGAGIYVRQIGRAISTDGIAWTRAPATPVLGPGEPLKFDEFGVGKPSVLFDGTTWHMWYSNQDRDVNHDVPASPRIGYATSADGIVWTRQNSGDAVLERSAAGWDAWGVSAPAVLLDGGTFKMWFTGFEYTDSFQQIGYAESADGVAWTKRGIAVLPTTPGGADWVAVSDPAVVKDGATYRMWYATRTSSTWRVRYAQSSSGTSWERYTDAPIFEPSTYDYDYDAVHGPSVVKDGDRWVLWYFSEGLRTAGAIFRATNP